MRTVFCVRCGSSLIDIIMPELGKCMECHEYVDLEEFPLKVQKFPKKSKPDDEIEDDDFRH